MKLSFLLQAVAILGVTLCLADPVDAQKGGGKGGGGGGGRPAGGGGFSGARPGGGGGGNFSRPPVTRSVSPGANFSKGAPANIQRVQPSINTAKPNIAKPATPGLRPNVPATANVQKGNVQKGVVQQGNFQKGNVQKGNAVAAKGNQGQASRPTNLQTANRAWNNNWNGNPNNRAWNNNWNGNPNNRAYYYRNYPGNRYYNNNYYNRGLGYGYGLSSLLFPGLYPGYGFFNPYGLYLNLGRFGLGIGGFGGYGYGYPYGGYRDYYYANPVYVYNSPPVINTVPPVVIQQATAATAPVKLQFVLPEADASIWIENQLIAGTGTEREYSSAPLETGYRYYYNLKASWLLDGERITLERQVEVTPGQTTVVDFTRPPGKAQEEAPAPAAK
jgi:uncharacterized protein (TIGR03000 family)